MADSPASSDLSDVPSLNESEPDYPPSTAAPSTRQSVDINHTEPDHLQPPTKRRKTGTTSLSTFDRAHSSQPPEQEDDNISISSDGFSNAPEEPNTHDEWALRDEAQTQCLWRDCPFGDAYNNDELVKHVQGTHCATGGPKKTKYVCEWGECQRKTSNHPSGYALKAHMRSHTKEKPYYCALPECDKAFTRSDALAKHMRTVHEPEMPRGAAGSLANEPTPPSKRKQKLTNGSAAKPNLALPYDAVVSGPVEDEDGNPVNPSPANDNITYIPAHHPITGQPGFMIHYPPDINFTSWESSIPANHLMSLLRRQLHWAKEESFQLRQENELLEEERKQEWLLKEILLEGVMEAELAHADRDELLADVSEQVKDAMEHDVEPAKRLPWTPNSPAWRRPRPPRMRSQQHLHQLSIHDTAMPDVATAATPEDGGASRTPSPPPTGKSGGFDGDEDPYDNYVEGRIAEFERLRAEKEKLKESAHNTPLKMQQSEAEAEAEADAVGALMGMSGGQTG